MKKLTSLAGLVFILIALIAVSCEKPLDEKLLGKWEVTIQKTQAFNADVLVDQEIDTLEANEMVIEILEDGTGKTYFFGDVDSEFSWTLDGNMLTITITGKQDYNIMEFEVNLHKDTLTLVWTVDQPPAKIGITKIVTTIIAKRA
jgi:hypothetical protein